MTTRVIISEVPNSAMPLVLFPQLRLRHPGWITVDIRWLKNSKTLTTSKKLPVSSRCFFLKYLTDIHLELKHYRKFKELTVRLGDKGRNGTKNSRVNIIWASSTMTLLLTEQWMIQFMDAREPVDVVLFDFARAFDSVNQRYLCIKLDAYGVHPKIVEWIRSFHIHRFFRIRVHDASSLPFIAGSGVPQGSIMGPLLFLLFANDLPDLLQGKALLFADDVKIISPLRSAWDWSVMWHLPLNPRTCCRPPIWQPTPSPLALTDGFPGAMVETAKDFGVAIDASFTPSLQCREGFLHARAVFFMMRRGFAELTPSLF